MTEGRLRSVRGSFSLVMTTVGSLPAARRLARAAVTARLAACANISSGIRSFYWWKAQLEEGQERVLLLKTDRGRLPALSKFIRRHHPYELPEILVLPVSHGETSYLQWITENLKHPSQKRLTTKSARRSMAEAMQP